MKEVDIAPKTLRQEVEAEMYGEIREEAKKRLKVKLKDLRNAKLAVANIEREIEDLEREIAAGL